MTKTRKTKSMNSVHTTNRSNPVAEKPEAQSTGSGASDIIIPFPAIGADNTLPFPGTVVPNIIDATAHGAFGRQGQVARKTSEEKDTSYEDFDLWLQFSC